MSEKLVLIGNPNVGKTTLYNKLTKSFEHTGNWHGVTVDERSKSVEYENNQFEIVDVPGLYSLTSYSFEEQVSIDYIFNNSCKIINICDANILERNLYLTLQLLEAGFCPILLVNFDKEVKRKGIEFDYNKLASKLNIKILKNDASIKSNLFESIGKITNKQRDLDYFKQLPIKEILNILTQKQKKMFNFSPNFLAIKILENDEKIMEKLVLDQNQKSKIMQISKQKDYLTYISSLRYAYISNIINDCVKKKKEVVYGKFKFDKIVLNKFLCLPIFLCILFAIFYLTFSSLGAYLSDGLKLLIDKFVGEPINNFLIKVNAPSWIIGLFANGIISGVGGLLSFIPQIVLLFLFLSLLEDSGYMSRLAFSFEDIFYKFGLSGKSIFTILMSFGCTTTAVLTARNIEDKNTKIKTAMISPYMSCSAKLPIYAVIGGAFFGKGNIFIIILMYLLGVIVGLAISNILSKSKLKSGERSFILEFPPYRKPSGEQIFLTIAQNIKLFVIKVSTILLSFSVIVWILQNFSFTFAYVPATPNAVSMLQSIGTALVVIFKPIGLGNWGIVVSLLVGVMAKEMVVGTMAIINKVPNTADFDRQLGMSLVGSSYVINFSPLTAFIMIVFSLLYMPCISTIAVLKKEIGTKLTFLTCLLQFSVAYAICFVIYQFATGTIIARIILSIIVIAIITTIFAISHKLTKQKGFCGYKCKNCTHCCH